MNEPLIYVLDDDADLGAALVRLVERSIGEARAFTTSAAMLEAAAKRAPCVLLCDVMLGDEDGFVVAERLRAIDPAIALLFMTAWPITAHAVDAIRRHGGIDYLEKPIDRTRLMASIDTGIAWSREQRTRGDRLSGFTPRERDVLGLLLKGHSSKGIAKSLDISVRTVEDHRARVMAKAGTSSLAELMARFGD